MRPDTPTSSNNDDTQADFDVPRFLEYVAAKLPHLASAVAAGRVSLKRIAGGQSNPTFFITIGGNEYVLRKAPNGTALPGAHAVNREYRIMDALYGRGVPVPKMILLENDPDVLGARFYLMERLDGEVVHTSLLPDHSPEQREAIYADKAKVLANLHQVDLEAAGLADYGRQGPFFTRQIHRWTKQWELSKTRELPEIDQVAQWRKENDKGDETSAIVHGDYRIGNLMLHRDEPQIIGVLDWELSTLGNPLADLAHTVCMWHITPEEYGGLLGADLGRLGIPGRAQFEETYMAAAGLSNGLTTFHHAFTLFRMAVIFEGIAARALAGTASSDNAHTVGALSAVLARRAAEIIASDRALA